MKTINCFIPYADAQQVQATVDGLRQNALVSKIFLLATDANAAAVEGCEVINIDALNSSATMKKIAAAAELEVATAEELTAETEVGKAYALAYAKVLGPDAGNMSAEIKDYLLANQNDYATSVTKNVEFYLKKF